MKRLGILGASGHGKVVAEAALTRGWGEVRFYDDAWPGKSKLGSWEVIGNTSTLLADKEHLDGVIVAIGDNAIRIKKIQELQKMGLDLVTIVHAAAVVSNSAKLGIGTVVMAGAVVNAGAEIGVGAILNTACSVDHDCFLGVAVHVSPGARLAGGVLVGDRSWVGIGASVRQGTIIGAGVVIGTGAAVVSDIADGLTVVGVPAKPLLSGGG